MSRLHNKYDLSNEYGIGYTSNTNIPFYFDLDKFDVIYNYYWYERKDGYIEANLWESETKKNTTILLHRLIMNTPDGMDTDHKNGKESRNDNRASNLRIATRSQNQRNQGLHSHNTSGHTGVSWSKTKNKWRAYIELNGKYKHLGYFVDIDEAIKARITAEKHYYGEWRYEKIS